MKSCLHRRSTIETLERKTLLSADLWLKYDGHEREDPENGIVTKDFGQILADELFIDFPSLGFDPAQHVPIIKQKIETRVANVYTGFDVVLHAGPQPPSGATTVDFGAVGSGFYGRSGIDILNKAGAGNVDIFVSEFDDVLLGPEPVNQNNPNWWLDELGLAMGSTVAHEFAHSVGLRHSFAYGDPSVPAAQSSGPDAGSILNTQDQQNQHLMATPVTGQPANYIDFVET